VGLVAAAQLFDLPVPPRGDADLPVVLLSDALGQYGLIVEAFRGEQDLVVRALDARLGKVPNVSAASILDDGAPVLIADVEDLMHSMKQLIQTGTLRHHEPAALAAAAPRKRVLVVDDSITVRETERLLLRQRGYDVTLAVDGMDGWNRVRAEAFDLVVSDVDMPRLNGLDLVRAMRDDESLKEVPVIIVSYKDREEDRLRGLEVGASYYLTKGSFHDNTFLQAVTDLIGEALVRVADSLMRVAIVNDLSLAREVLRQLVLSVAGYRVAWMAEDGAEAVRQAARDRPDVSLMDLVMPVMDGVEATRQIMAASPCPILLVTSSVNANFNKVYAAMGHGGLDAVNTPVLGPGGTVQEGEALLARIARLAQVRRMPVAPASGSAPVARAARAGPADPTAPALPALLALGASTGGPEALAQVLGGLPAGFPAAVVLVQHIASSFAPSLASWLQTRTALPVRVAGKGDEPRPGTALLAATDQHLILRRDRRLAYTPPPNDHPYPPSIDVFLDSLASSWPRPGVAVLLTGMGSDGARGFLHLRQAGWLTIAQDEATSVVYGMPKAAAELNAACRILPLPEIAAAIRADFRIGRSPAPGLPAAR
jgi:two-component system response regulator WspF